MQTLKDVLPHEFHNEFSDTPAYKLKDVEVLAEHALHGDGVQWPGKHANVHVWYELANGKAVGWNENPSRGWSFPVITHKAVKS